MSTPATSRLSSIDNLRGLILAIMALDHASVFIHHRHSSEFWSGPFTQYTSALTFLTRFVTHLCAPGFFFLMGIGMYLFADSRRQKGWPASKVMLHFAKRGALIIVLCMLVEQWAWILGTQLQIHADRPPPSSPQVFRIPLPVLWGLGTSMITGGLLIQTRGFVGVISALLILLSNALVPQDASVADSYPVWLRMLFLPGPSGRLWILYPLLPWLGICGLGIAFGRVLAASPTAQRRAMLAAPIIGIMFIIAALTIRHVGGFGNLRLPRDGSWIEFLNFIKYPPALTFTLFMLGVNLILLSLLRGRVPVLHTLGQAPLCFYFAHLYLYASLGAIFFRHASAVATLYVVWLLGLVPLYFACRAFRRFKETKDAESLWRLF